MSYTLNISFQMNRTLLTKKEQLLSSGGMFLVDLLKSLKKTPKSQPNKNPAPNTFLKIILTVYVLQFRRTYTLTVSSFLLQVYVENMCYGFSFIFLASCYQFTEQFIYIDHYAQFSHHFYILFLSSSCFQFLIETRLVFPIKTADRMQFSDLTINAS